MSPYDLPGPEFLVLYANLLFAVVVCAELLRRWLRKPGVEVDRADPPLTPYEVAYLAEGRQGAVYAAVAGLIRKEAVSLNEKKHLVASESFTGITHPLEWEVYENVRSTQDAPVRQVTVKAPLDRIRDSLEEQGLLVTAGQRLRARLLPAMFYLGLMAFGVGKIVVGVDRHKPVAFLVALVVLTAIIGLARFCWPVHRSRRGDDLVRRLRSRNAALKTTLRTAGASVGSDDTALGVALFGTCILHGGPLNDLAVAVQPPAGAGGGGGDAGGGCGGGGGGCGGGGCGGCGG
jgi:uncharacterized protein (TIGR04222 family)